MINTGTTFVVNAGLGIFPNLISDIVSSPAGSVVIDDTVNIAGPDQSFRAAGALIVGQAGAGSLSLSQGATVTAGSLDAGELPAADGRVSLTGTGTGLTLFGAATVGDAGAGTLTVLNGATFTATDLTIGAHGSVVVSGIGSEIDVSGVLNSGTSLGNGEITVGPGAVIHASVVNLEGNAVLEGGLLDPTVQIVNNGSIVGGFGTILADYIIDEGVIQAGGTKPSQRKLLVDGTVVGGGTLIVNGTVQPSSAAGILQINALGTLELTGPVLNAASSTFQDGVPNTYTVNNSIIDVLFEDGAGVLLLDDIADFDGTIATFQIGDQFVIPGGTLSGLDVSNGNTLTVSDSGAGAGSGGIDQIIFGEPISPLEFGIVNGNTIGVGVLCFCAGTMIATPDGETAVERLAVGDTVLTAGGARRTVNWIGAGRVLATRGRRSAATPVIVRKGALEDNVPHHDLRVTKGHALCLNDVLIPVEFLINHRSILWDDRAQEVSLYHVELDAHDVMLANGAPAESYRDDGNRWLFQNANSGWYQPAQAACLPVLTGGPIVDAAWRRLLDRSGPRPGVPLTDDPDLHLLVNGKRIDPVGRQGAAHMFHLPTVPRTFHIVSRAASPAELGLSRDPRALGVAVRQIRFWQGKRLRVIETSDASLTHGFHQFEPDEGVRWTDGDATLPNSLLANVTGPCMVELMLAGATLYPLFAEVSVPAAV